MERWLQTSTFASESTWPSTSKIQKPIPHSTRRTAPSTGRPSHLRQRGRRTASGLTAARAAPAGARPTSLWASPLSARARRKSDFRFLASAEPSQPSVAAFAKKMATKTATRTTEARTGSNQGAKTAILHRSAAVTRHVALTHGLASHFGTAAKTSKELPERDLRTAGCAGATVSRDAGAQGAQCGAGELSGEAAWRLDCIKRSSWSSSFLPRVKAAQPA
mmetsp:Transcript_29350/g.101449  ORF Transcript_29350/g.101449 Transcript_29350/m.101449 type:complete len:220 (-) Transcript_29350:201-860(-)